MSSNKRRKDNINSQSLNNVDEDSYDESAASRLINKSLATIVREIQAVQNDSVMSEYSIGNVSHVYKCEKSINMLLLQEQNLPYPESCTDVLIRCSNGHIRSHSLLMMSSTLILDVLKEKQEGGNINDDGSRSIALNGYKVEHISKILFLFYAGRVIFTVEKEKKIILRLLEILGVNLSPIVVNVPLLNSVEYKNSMHDKMRGLQLRISLTRMSHNNEKVEDEYFIRPDGSMELLDKEWNLSEIIVLHDVETGFYCPICKSTYAGHGTLQRHLSKKHGVQNDRSRNQERHSIAQGHSIEQGPIDMRVSTTTTEQPYLDQPCTSAEARKQLALTKLKQPNVVGSKERRTRQPETPEQGDCVIILPPSATSTPTAQADTSRRLLSQIARQNGNLNYLSCGVCSLVTENDDNIRLHLQHCHSRLSDDTGKYLGIPCQAKDSDSFNGTRCISCGSKYLSAMALKDHYRKDHEIIDAEHYVLSPIPKCLVCKTKIGNHHEDGIDATKFFDHVRRCRIGMMTLAEDNPNKKKRTPSNITGKNVVQPTKLVKWSSVANMKMLVAEVLQQPAAKRKISSKPVPRRNISIGQVASQQKKKKKLDSNEQMVDQVLNTTHSTSVRVLRSGRPIIKDQRTKASKIPQKRAQPRVTQLPTSSVDQEQVNNILRLSNVNSQSGRSTSRNSNQVLGPVPAAKNTTTTGIQKKTGLRGRPRNENVVAVQRVQQSAPRNEETSDDSIILVPIDENSRVLRLGTDNDVETPNGDDDEENNDGDKENMENGEQPRGSKSIGNRLSSASLAPGTPQYHSTCIFDVDEHNKQQTPHTAARVAALRLKKIGEAPSATAEWVCNTTQENVQVDTSNQEPETQRSSDISLYMTPEQTVEHFSDLENIEEVSNSDSDHFQGISESMAAKITQAAIEYVQIIQNQSVSHSFSNLSNESSDQSVNHQTTWLLECPDDTFFLI